MSRWLQADDRPGADDYDRKFVEAARAGQDVHGEASFVAGIAPTGASILDAGCGTGRVAIELARRGFAVVGADLDPGMLAGARAKAPELEWRLADLAAHDLRAGLGLGAGGLFDVVVAAGNVMIFLEPGSEAGVTANLARLLAPGGALVAGFQLDRHVALEAYDEHCRLAGLALAERWATWDRAPWRPGGAYAVSVHRSTGPPAG